MIPPLPYGETVTLHRDAVTGQDDYGNDVVTETQVSIPGCAVWPRSAKAGSDEIGGDRTTVIAGLTILVPPGVVVRPTDQMSVRGAVWQVDGEPGLWRSHLTGTEAGTEIALRRVEG